MQGHNNSDGDRLRESRERVFFPGKTKVHSLKKTLFWVTLHLVPLNFSPLNRSLRPPGVHGLNLSLLDVSNEKQQGRSQEVLLRSIESTVGGVNWQLCVWGKWISLCTVVGQKITMVPDYQAAMPKIASDPLGLATRCRVTSIGRYFGGGAVWFSLFFQLSKTPNICQ